MPQVHIVAYCADLGYGLARGAEMLSVMLGLGRIARVASGSIADKIGGLGALLIGSTLQAFALLLYLGFNGLTSLYVVSALFGLFQGGIIPMYAVIVREYFPPREAGTRVGFPLMLIPGGGLNSLIAGLDSPSHPFNAITEFQDEYRCIAADLRNANGGESSGPLEVDRPWHAYTDDHIGLMDHLGIKNFLV